MGSGMSMSMTGGKKKKLEQERQTWAKEVDSLKSDCESLKSEHAKQAAEILRLTQAHDSEQPKIIPVHSISPSWRAKELFSASKVDGFIPQTQHVDLH